MMKVMPIFASMILCLSAVIGAQDKALEDIIDGIYLRGRGKVMIFIKFNFEVEEFYFDYKINTGLTDNIFGEANNED
ncbi:MAG: hypothetical protein V3V99_07705 [candidate division Zixibacteria bacterium]